ncbi:hypothetical protein [Kitasatospora sp. MBT66]|uniref:hypothetical protein n=1 Tax=Kitasatospora sp. MBT66 TaxID=1444769 RepID=UPI0005B9B0ED|nr:hypothetical protein [Kitasatospora sp. MBT66]
MPRFTLPALPYFCWAAVPSGRSEGPCNCRPGTHLADDLMCCSACGTWWWWPGPASRTNPEAMCPCCGFDAGQALVSPSPVNTRK